LVDVAIGVGWLLVDGDRGWVFLSPVLQLFPAAWSALECKVVVVDRDDVIDFEVVLSRFPRKGVINADLVGLNVSHQLIGLDHAVNAVRPFHYVPSEIGIPPWMER
jgi:hypothetical protein